jgi:hypothetical protein
MVIAVARNQRRNQQGSENSRQDYAPVFTKKYARYSVHKIFFNRLRKQIYKKKPTFVKTLCMDNLFSIVILALALIILGLHFFPGKKRTAKNATSGDVNLQALQLQAYERLILLMERINPTELVLRHHNRAGTVADLHLLLLNTVRDETAHNCTQQLYVSNEAWAQVMAARNTITNLINQSAAALQPGDPAIALSKKILDNAALLDPSPTLNAVKAIKQEARRNIKPQAA